MKTTHWSPCFRVVATSTRRSNYFVLISIPQAPTILIQASVIATSALPAQLECFAMRLAWVLCLVHVKLASFVWQMLHLLLLMMELMGHVLQDTIAWKVCTRYFIYFILGKYQFRSLKLYHYSFDCLESVAWFWRGFLFKEGIIWDASSFIFPPDIEFAFAPSIQKKLIKYVLSLKGCFKKIR